MYLKHFLTLKLVSRAKKWKSDFKKITNGNIKDVSDKYIDYLRKFYDNNPIIDIIFGREMKEV